MLTNGRPLLVKTDIQIDGRALLYFDRVVNPKIRQVCRVSHLGFRPLVMVSRYRVYARLEISKMTISTNWLKSGLGRQYAADEADHLAVGAPGSQEQESDDPYDDETSFNLYGEDPDDGRVTASPSGTAEELSSSDTLPVRTLTIDEDSTYIVEESVGVDPYNTGRFNAAES
jgi:hypothetical protein